MKALQCEMCGSVDLVKQDGLFVCQYCRTKYSVEEARKMMIEGSVKIDNTNQIENLLIRAKQFEYKCEYEKALEYYNRVLDIDANNETAMQRMRIIEGNDEIVYLDNIEVTSFQMNQIEKLIDNHKDGEAVVLIRNLTGWETEKIYNWLDEYRINNSVKDTIVQTIDWVGDYKRYGLEGLVFEKKTFNKD